MIYPWLNGSSHAVFIPSSLTEFKARLTEQGNELGDVKAELKALEAADQCKLTFCCFLKKKWEVAFICVTRKFMFYLM